MKIILLFLFLQLFESSFSKINKELTIYEPIEVNAGETFYINIDSFEIGETFNIQFYYGFYYPTNKDAYVYFSSADIEISFSNELKSSKSTSHNQAPPTTLYNQLRNKIYVFYKTTLTIQEKTTYLLLFISDNSPEPVTVYFNPEPNEIAKKLQTNQIEIDSSTTIYVDSLYYFLKFENRILLRYSFYSKDNITNLKVYYDYFNHSITNNLNHYITADNYNKYGDNYEFYFYLPIHKYTKSFL